MPLNAFDLPDTATPQQRQEFEAFFVESGLLPALTYAHKFEAMSVSYLQMLAVINPTGAYRQPLKDFANVLHVNNESKRFDDSIADITYKSNSIQRFVNYAKEITELFLAMDDNDGRQWYIVWYEILDN